MFDKESNVDIKALFIGIVLGISVIIGIIAISFVLKNAEYKASYIELKKLFYTVEVNKGEVIDFQIHNLLKNDNILTKKDIEDITEYFKTRDKQNKLKVAYKEIENTMQNKTMDDIFINGLKSFGNSLGKQEHYDKALKYETNRNKQIANCKKSFLDKADELLAIESPNNEVLTKANVLISRYSLCIEEMN